MIDQQTIDRARVDDATCNELVADCLDCEFSKRASHSRSLLQAIGWVWDETTQAWVRERKGGR